MSAASLSKSALVAQLAKEAGLEVKVLPYRVLCKVLQPKTETRKQGGAMHYDGNTRMAFKVSRAQLLGKINARIAEIDAAKNDKVLLAKLTKLQQARCKEVAQATAYGLKKAAAEAKKIQAFYNKQAGVPFTPEAYEQMLSFGSSHSSTHLTDFPSVPEIQRYLHWCREMAYVLRDLNSLKATLEMSVDEKIAIRNHSMRSTLDFLSEPLPLPGDRPVVR